MYYYYLCIYYYLLDRHDLVGGSFSVSFDLWSFMSSSDAKCPSLFMLPPNPDVKLLVPSLEPCLPAYCHTFHHDDN